MKLRDVWRLLVCLEYCGAVGLLKVRLKQCVHVQVVGLCVHVYLCTGCSKNWETVLTCVYLCTKRSKCREIVRALVCFVQGVLKVDKLCVHVYLCTGCSKNWETVRTCVYLCTRRSKCWETVRALVCFVQGVLKVDRLRVHVIIFAHDVLNYPCICFSLYRVF
jgi:hypothetical protein